MKKLEIINKKRKSLGKSKITIEMIRELCEADYSEGFPDINNNAFKKEFCYSIIRYRIPVKNPQIEMHDKSKVDLTEKAILKYLMWWYFYSQCDFRAEVTDDELYVIPIDSVHLGFKKLNNFLPFAHLEIKKLFELKDQLTVKEYRRFNVSL